MTNSTHKKPLLYSFLLSLFCLTVQAQENTLVGSPAPNTPTEVQYAASITQDDLKSHLQVLASDEYEGRETGAKGQKMAAEYIANHFKSLDIPPTGEDGTYFQPFELANQTWGEDVYIKIGGKRYDFMKDFYSFAGTTQPMEATIDEVVFLGYGIEDETYSDYKGIDVTDKVLLIFSGEPRRKSGQYVISGTKEPSKWSGNWRSKLELAKQKGAKALMVIAENVQGDIESYGYYIKNASMQLRSNKKGGRFVNSVYISKEMAQDILGNKRRRQLDRLQKKINKKGKTKSITVKEDLVLSLKKEGEVIISENVLGYLEGTDLKDEVLVLTAHYDHLGKKGEKIYNGADDDGSGTVAILEAAQAFADAKAAGNGPRRSILFMLVSGEEKGLLGSKYYTDIEPIFPLENTVANLNIDMVGRVDKEHTDGDYVYVIGSDKLSTELHNINEKMNQEHTKLDLDYKYNDDNDPNRFYYRSDHYNFAKNNIPIIFYFNGTHDDYHQDTDTVDKINFEALQKRAQLMFYTAWQLANQDKRIEVDKVTEN